METKGLSLRECTNNAAGAGLWRMERSGLYRSRYGARCGSGAAGCEATLNESAESKKTGEVFSLQSS